MKKSIDTKVEDIYYEIDITLGEKKIGHATVAFKKKELSNFEIYEPFQNKGYGTQALEQLIMLYGIKRLEVRNDNEIAKHLYQKMGFRFADTPTYHTMTRECDTKVNKKNSMEV